MSNLVPLPEVLSEIAASGVGSKTVERMYDRVVGALGPELSILGEVPVEDIARAESSVLAEAITRLRAGKVIRDAGYDGEYGVIKLFEDGELKRLGGMLFEAPVREARLASEAADVVAAEAKSTNARRHRHSWPRTPAPFQRRQLRARHLALDPDQRRAAEIVEGPAADPRRAGRRQDPHADAPHRATWSRARRAAGKLPRRHLHAPRRGRDARRG